jgi:protein-L-isoaspartate(D-aspartate) O-methyltransferase
VGGAGSVDGYEIVESVARRAVEALSDRANVQIHASSGASVNIADADLIYVCAGASRPGVEWLNALKLGGRLVFPLTPARGFGGILRVERCRDPETQYYLARFICPALFIACEGMRGPEADELTAAFSTRAMSDVKTLRTQAPPDASAWFVWRDDLWLSTTAPDAAD